MAQEQDKERAQPDWWRKRADEIEVEVARSGSRVAMRCYTDMRTLLQAATTAAPQPNAALADGWLNPEDMAALERFNECAEDSDAGGHDVPKERMKRLAELGVVQALGFGRHEVTAFGSVVLGSSFARKPLETTEECNARLGREHRAKLGTPTPPTLNASKEDGNG